MRRCHAWDNVVIVPYFLVTYRTWLYTISNSSDQIILYLPATFFIIYYLLGILILFNYRDTVTWMLCSLAHFCIALKLSLFFCSRHLYHRDVSITCVWMYIYSGNPAWVAKCQSVDVKNKGIYLFYKVIRLN